MTRPLLVAVCGPARSGKDTAIAAIAAEVEGVVVTQWADVLKRVVALMGGLTDDEVEGRGYDREQPEPRLGGRSVRHALQFVGDEVGRELDPDLWVRATLRDLEVKLEASPGARLVLVSGTRRPNERAACDRAWWVYRADAPPVRDHGSERALSPGDCDVVLHNNGTLGELRRAAVALARHELGER